MKLDFLEQQIYNTFLKHSRKGQPWKPRKDFTDFSEKDHFTLQKLKAFFVKFKHIKIDDFFGAPNFLHPDEPFPQLTFFVTRGAIKTYNNFQKLTLNQNPDLQIESIKEGFKFLATFCLEHKTKLEEYLHHKTGCMPTWTEHYRLYSVNPYCLMELGDLNLREFSEDEISLWAPNLIDNFSAYKNRYHNSIEAKKIVKKATAVLKTFIEEQLQKDFN